MVVVGIFLETVIRAEIVESRHTELLGNFSELQNELQVTRNETGFLMERTGGVRQDYHRPLFSVYLFFLFKALEVMQRRFCWLPRKPSTGRERPKKSS